VSDLDPQRPLTDPDGGPAHVVHLVRTSNFAGVERSVSYLAPELVRRGLEVTVVGGDPDRMAGALTGTGVTHRPSGTLAEDLRALVACRPTLVHAHMTDAEVVAVLGKVWLSCPVVATLHFAKPRGRDRLRRTVFRPLPRGLAAQIAISRFVADTSGQPDATVILNGVPWDHVPRPREQVVLVTQRLEAEKDTATALRAWAASGLAADGWRLVVAGDGAERSHLEQMARHLGVDESVELVGAVRDIAERQARAALFLATAPAEPFGLAVVEAMAAGTPVVAAAGGGHLETAGRVGTGHLFAPGDAEAAAAVLRRLADDPAARTALGEALRAEYLRHLTIEHQTTQLIDVYRRVLADREPPAPTPRAPGPS
jgi:glycosyltransferase involved in cell wall biosynthesis